MSLKVASGTVSLMRGGTSWRLAMASMSVGICMQCVRLRSTMWMTEKPSVASRMAALAAVKPKRCQGVRSTKLASSMTENLWVSMERLVRA